MPTEKVILHKIESYCQQVLDKDLIVDVEFDIWMDSFVINIIRKQLAMKAGERIIRHPENWKEAFKERWFPGWLKRRHLVKYKEYDALVIFPDLLKKHPIPEGMRNINYYFTYSEHGRILGDETFDLLGYFNKDRTHC